MADKHAIKLTNPQGLLRVESKRHPVTLDGVSRFLDCGSSNRWTAEGGCPYAINLLRADSHAVERPVHEEVGNSEERYRQHRRQSGSMTIGLERFRQLNGQQPKQRGE